MRFTASIRPIDEMQSGRYDPPCCALSVGRLIFGGPVDLDSQMPDSAFHLGIPSCMQSEKLHMQILMQIRSPSLLRQTSSPSVFRCIA